MKISDIVFTDHAIRRMKERGITGQWAIETIKKADHIKPGKEKHTTEFEKTIDGKKITAIGKKNEINDWIILSVWRDPPLEGTDDYRKYQSYKKLLEKNRMLDRKMEKASFLEKLWLTFRKQIGI